MGQEASNFAGPLESFEGVPHITSTKTKRLYARYWEPAEGTPLKAIMCISHGVGEHIERYERFAKELNQHGILVFGHDHVGHGRSEGLPVHVDDFLEYVDDVVHHVKIMQEKHPNVPTVLFGHSMGGEIAYLASLNHPEYFKLVVLSGPAIFADPNVATPFKVFLAKVVSGIAPQMIVGKLPIESLSRNEEEVQKYLADKYVWRDGVKAAWGVAMMNAQSEGQARMSEFKLPLLIIHGTADGLCPIDGSRQLLEAAGSEDKELKEYEGAYHEVLNELPEVAQRATQDIVDWLNARL